MGVSMVRRRIAGYAKVKPKPRAPAPRRNDDDNEQMVGERPKPSAPLAAFAVRQAPQRTWWQKAGKPIAIAAGILVLCGVAFMALKDTVQFASGYSTSANSNSSASSSSAHSGADSSPRRGGQSSAYPDGHAGAEEVVLSNRSIPTDESFLAAGYARRKVALPKAAPSGAPGMTGECVVTGGGITDINECLRQQGRR